MSSKNVHTKMKIEDLRDSVKEFVFLGRNSYKDYVIIQNEINQMKYSVLETRTLFIRHLVRATPVTYARRVMATPAKML
jgi:hypothetical protein